MPRPAPSRSAPWLAVLLAVGGLLRPAPARAQHDRKTGDVPEVEARAVLYGDKHYPARVAMTPDGKTVISTCGAFSGVRFWDVARKAERARGTDHTGRGVLALALS